MMHPGKEIREIAPFTAVVERKNCFWTSLISSVRMFLSLYLLFIKLVLLTVTVRKLESAVWHNLKLVPNFLKKIHESWTGVPGKN